MDYQPPHNGGRIEDALDAIRRELASLAQKVALLEYKVSQFHGSSGASQTTWIIVLAAIVIAGAAFSILAIYILRATLP